MKAPKKKVFEQQWISARQAATMMGCSVATVYQLVKQRKLKAVKITGSRDLRFQPQWIDDWMLKNLTTDRIAV